MVEEWRFKKRGRGGRRLRVVGRRGDRCLFPGICRIPVRGTETPTVPSATLLGGTAHLGGPNSRPLVHPLYCSCSFTFHPCQTYLILPMNETPT